MDPNACIDRLVRARNNGDEAEVRAAAEDLAVWLRGGGFLPERERGRVIDLCNVIVSYAVVWEADDEQE